MKKNFRAAVLMAVLILLFAISIFAYFKIVNYRDQIICITNNRKVNLNFGKIDGAYCNYYKRQTTFIYFKNLEDKQEFINCLIKSKYFKGITFETNYKLIKDGYVFDFETIYSDYIACNSYQLC